MAWIVLTFLTISLLDTACALVQYRYSHDANMSGKVPIDVTSVSVRSIRECAAMCNQHDQCLSFYHSTADTKCFLDTDGNLSNFTKDAFARYFSKDGYTDVVSSTTVETSTEPSALSTTQVLTSSCPATFQEDLQLIGTSGNSYTYKIFNSSVIQGIALLTCHQQGMKLIKMDEEDKIRDLASFLTHCDVYDANGYWADVSKINQYFDWRTSDGIGEILDIAWCGGTPEHSHEEPCARLNRDCSFKLNDIWCDQNYFFICE